MILGETSPFRVRLQRRANWKLPPRTRSVARPHPWGNPYVIGKIARGGVLTAILRHDPSFEGRDGGLWVPDAATAVRAYRCYLDLNPELKAQARRELAGWNLACWCQIEAPCHGDVLLEIANSPVQNRR